jgi:putative IMPACT (imprinted ancient) family translation regulator
VPSRDAFRTLAAASAVQPPKTRGSRFLGEASPAASEAEAVAHVEAVRQREHAATHVAWAWRLGPGGDVARWGDDGEPSGSAGAPILREIEGRDLTDAVVTVTRTYGGTKLGVGGLARAYGGAAAAALDAARVREVVVRVPVRLRFAFADTAGAMRLLDVFDAEVAGQTHSPAGTELALRVRRSEAGALAAAFVEATAGRGEVVEG